MSSKTQKKIEIVLPAHPAVLETIGKDDNLDTWLADPSLRVGYAGVPVMREPQWIVSPDGEHTWALAHEVIPADILPGSGSDRIEARPTTTKLARCEFGGILCPNCGDKHPKRGYLVYSPPGEPDIVWQCLGCGVIGWQETKRSWQEGERYVNSLK